jgi:hypothetical protein
LSFAKNGSWETKAVQAKLRKANLKNAHALVDLLEFFEPEKIDIFPIGDEIFQVKLIKNCVVILRKSGNCQGIEFIVSGEIELIIVEFHKSIRLFK